MSTLVPDTDLDFSRLSGELSGLKPFFERIDPIESIFYLFIALALLRVFRRSRKTAVPTPDIDAVQDKDYERRKMR